MEKLKDLLSEAQLNRILKSTDSKRKRKAENIASNLITVIKYNTQKGSRFHFKLKSESQSGRGKYDVNFRTPIQYGINENNWKNVAGGGVSMLVNCSCADFKYRWETVLHSAGNARLETSNGDAPDIRNPEHKEATCKHIQSAWSVVKEYIKKKDFTKFKKKNRV